MWKEWSIKMRMQEAGRSKASVMKSRSGFSILLVQWTHLFYFCFFFWWLFFPFPFCWHPSYLAVADWSLQMPPQRYRLLFFDINLLRLDAIRRSVVCLVTLSTCTVSYWRHWRVVLLLCYYAHPILSLLNSFAFLLT